MVRALQLSTREYFCSRKEDGVTSFLLDPGSEPYRSSVGPALPQNVLVTYALFLVDMSYDFRSQEVDVLAVGMSHVTAF